jgi:hypothetical protein
VSAASVYRRKKLLAESPVPGRHPAGPGKLSAGATKSPRSTFPFPAVQVRGDDRQVNPARPSDALDSSRSVLRIVLPNGVVIRVAGDLDGDMCLCIALRNLAGLPIPNAISVNVAVALQHHPPRQRPHQRRLLHRRPGHQSLMLRNRIQHHAGRSVIWPPFAVQPSPSSAAAARSVIGSCEEIAIVSQ